MSLPQGCIWCNSLQPDMVHLKVHTLTCCERRPLDCSICKLIYTDEMLIAHFDCPFRRPENDVQMRNRFLRLSALILLNNELYPLPGDPTESEVVQLAISRFMLSKDSMQLVTVRSPWVRHNRSRRRRIPRMSFPVGSRIFLQKIRRKNLLPQVENTFVRWSRWVPQSVWKFVSRVAGNLPPRFGGRRGRSVSLPPTRTRFRGRGLQQREWNIFFKK